LKVARAIDELHRAQCLNYLTATGLHLCLLLTFGKPRLQIKRIVLALEGTAALCVFCVICGSIFLPVGQTALFYHPEAVFPQGGAGKPLLIAKSLGDRYICLAPYAQHRTAVTRLSCHNVVGGAVSDWICGRQRFASRKPS
jgi:hypothetical protein